MSQLITLEPAADSLRPTSRGLALFQLGFRPFYLLAAAFAAITLPLWVAVFCGWIDWGKSLGPALWHAHEMVYGFALAVISGFLFTAAKTWTGLATPAGRALVLRAALWIAARIAFAAGAVDWGVSLDLLFLASIALPLARILVATRNRRNYFVFLLLGAFAAADIVFWVAHNQKLDVSPMAPVHFGLFLVVMLISVMGGRVIPSFTANALPGVWQWRNTRLDQVALAFTAAALIAFLAGGTGMTSATDSHVATLTAALCIVAAALQTIRLFGWNPWATRKNPMLWILHTAYAWIPLGLMLAALATRNVLSPIVALHAFSVGAIGGMIIGMITRTALGHTGRPMRAGTAEFVMFGLIQLAAVIRVFLPLAWPARYVEFVIASGICWSIAFALYVAVYLPRLAQSRVDGRAG